MSFNKSMTSFKSLNSSLIK